MSENKLSVVTGATGHVGYALLTELINSGERPRVLAINERDGSRVADLSCDVVYGDITNADTLIEAFEGADVVYHLAGMVEIKAGYEDIIYKVNVNGTKNVVEACKKCGVKKLVYMSSVDTYVPLPDNQLMTELDHYDPSILEGAYAKSKAEATQYVLDSNGADGLETVVIQPSACIGPYDINVSSVGEMVRMYMAGLFPVSLGFGGYNFVDVRDIAYGTRTAAEKGRPGECYILCGDALTVDDFIRALAAAAGKKPPKVKLKKGFIDALLPLMEAYYKATGATPFLTKYSVRKLVSNCNFSYAKAQRDLDYHPMSVEKSVSDMMKWIVDNEGNPADAAVRKRKKAAKKAAKTKERLKAKKSF